MRLYTFTHYMLSPMAKGIQSTHATVELFNKYEKFDLYDIAMSTGEPPSEHLKEKAELGDMLYDWAENHKTVISLDAGVSPDLDLLVEYFENNSFLKLPWAYFKEDESLGNLVTSVAVIVPKRIYETVEALRNVEIVWNEEMKIFETVGLQWGGIWDRGLSQSEVDFVHKLKDYRMAK